MGECGFHKALTGLTYPLSQKYPFANSKKSICSLRSKVTVKGAEIN